MGFKSFISRHKRAFLCIGIIILLAMSILLLMFLKIIKPNKLFIKGYVRGCDVSEYQGEIDWKTLESEGISFTFIKATEGSGYTDGYFAENLENAMKTDLKVGAYHFFSYDSDGEKQAERFIDTVGTDGEKLALAIDVEFYGEYENKPLDSQKAVENIRKMVDAFYDYYGKKPIIYCTGKAYRLYIDGNFEDCGLWIRDVYFVPTVDSWDFWQYSDTEELDGYEGDEKYIDMNVFRGDLSELEERF